MKRVYLSANKCKYTSSRKTQTETYFIFVIYKTQILQGSNPANVEETPRVSELPPHTLAQSRRRAILLPRHVRPLNLEEILIYSYIFFKIYILHNYITDLTGDLKNTVKYSTLCGQCACNGLYHRSFPMHCIPWFPHDSGWEFPLQDPCLASPGSKQHPLWQSANALPPGTLHGAKSSKFGV